MHAAAARYVSVSELYSTDEVELLLDEIRDLEPTSCRGEDIQDFEIAGSGAGAAGGVGGGGGAGGSGARSPAGTERSWDSHAHYSRAPPAPPRPLAPVYCRLRYLLTATGATTLFVVVCSVCVCVCVWAGAGLRVWALPGAGWVRVLLLGALTSALVQGALLALHVTRLRALLPLRWGALGAAAALWSAASLLAGAAGALHALRTLPDYRAAPPRLTALLYTAAVTIHTHTTHPSPLRRAAPPVRVYAPGCSTKIFTPHCLYTSSAYVRPLLGIGLSHGTPLSTILGRSHPALASRLAKIIAPPSLRTSRATFADPWSPLENSSTPTVIGSSGCMAGPLPLRRSNAVGYVDNFGSLSDHLVTNSIF